MLKLVLSNDDITSSKNYLLTKLIDIKGIFDKANENGIFIIKIIPEKISKYLNNDINTFFGNTFIDDKKYSIDFLNNNEEEITFFNNSISSDLKIKEINNGSYIQFEDIINLNLNNYSLLSRLKTFEKQKLILY